MEDITCKMHGRVISLDLVDTGSFGFRITCLDGFIAFYTIEVVL